MNTKKETSPKYYKSGNIQEVVYHKQAQDYFERFSRDLGRRLAPKTGHPVFTRFHLYCHPPTLQHPNLYIKMMLANKAGGSVFTEMDISEFDELISDILTWRQKYDPEIKLGLANSLELRKRKHIQTTVGNILSDTSLDSNPIEELIQSTIPEQPKAINFEYIASIFLDALNKYNNATAYYQKQYYDGIMKACITDCNHDIQKFREEVLRQGVHPEQVYNELLPLSPKEIKLQPCGHEDCDYKYEKITDSCILKIFDCGYELELAPEDIPSIDKQKTTDIIQETGGYQDE